MDGDAVVVGTRFEAVGQGQRQIPGAPMIGPVGVGIVAAHQVVARHGQHVGGAAALFAPPAVEVACGDHVCGNAGVVEGEDLVVAGEQVAAAGPLLQFGQLRAQHHVVGEEMVPGLPVALHQGVPDEQFPAQCRVDGRVADPPARRQHQAVEGDANERHHFAARGVPVRLAVASRHQITGDALHGLRLDTRGHPAVEPAGLDQVGHHQPARRTFGENRAGREHEPDVARAGVLPAVVLTQPDMRQQSGHQRGVYARRIGRFTITRLPDPDVAGDAAQLTGEVLPLPDAQIVQELLAAHPAKGTARQCFALREQVSPQVQIGEEIAAVVGEAGMLGTRGLLGVGGPLPRIRDRQGRGEHQNLGHAAFGVGLQDHPAQAGINRKLRKPPSQRGDIAGGVEGPEFLQQCHAVAHTAAIRWVEEPEAFHLTELQRRHLKHHRGEVGAQNLRVGVARTVIEVLLGVQPDTHPRGGAPGPPGTLVGGSLRNRLDGQPLNLGAPTVAGDPRGAGVDDVADAWDRQRRFGDVGSQDDPAGQPAGVGGGVEYLLLLGGWQTRVQRQHLDAVECPAHRLRGVADLALTGQEDQHVPRGLVRQFVERVDDGFGLIARLDPHHFMIGIVGVVTVVDLRHEV